MRSAAAIARTGELAADRGEPSSVLLALTPRELIVAPRPRRHRAGRRFALRPRHPVRPAPTTPKRRAHRLGRTAAGRRHRRRRDPLTVAHPTSSSASPSSVERHDRRPQSRPARHDRARSPCPNAALRVVVDEPDADLPMTRLDDVVTDIADLLCPPPARPRRGRARDAPTGTTALSPGGARGALTAPISCRGVAGHSQAVHGSGPAGPGPTRRSGPAAPPLPRIARRGNQTRGGRPRRRPPRVSPPPRSRALRPDGSGTQ